MKIQAPALVTKISTKADGSIQVVMETPELAGEEMAKLFDLRKSQGWFLFSENTFKEEDVPTERAEIKGEKTPAQRLKATLYVLWEQQGRKGDFELFYRISMDRLNDQVKERLE